MKKMRSDSRTWPLAAALALSAAAALSQGTVLFQNDDRGLVYHWVGLTNSAVVPMGWDGLPHIQIAYAPAATTYTPVYDLAWTTEDWLAQNPGWILGPKAGMALLPSVGLFDGGTISLQGIRPGAEAEYVIFAWGLGDNFDEGASLGLWYGFAGPFTTLTGGAGQPPVSLADSFTGVTIAGAPYLIPEPPTLAVALLGAGMVAGWRRRPCRTSHQHDSSAPSTAQGKL
jgi:MYXO-CTERM domain-containing protein